MRVMAGTYEPLVAGRLWSTRSIPRRCHAWFARLRADLIKGVGVLRVRLCGGLAVEADGHALPDALLGGRQGRLAFAFLVCERSRTVRRQELAELLWAD